MIDVNKSCTGCRACEQVCPTHAIAIEENGEGFAYPMVYDDRCVHCGLCSEHCHLIQAKQSAEPAMVVGVVAKADELYAQSASAGVFTAIAEGVLAQNGCVFGCAYDARMKPHHRLIETVEELPLLQGSKYVESDLEDCYSQVKRQLQNGRLTLFCGTGCQVAGLKAFLGREEDNLLTIGLICHGVPSRKLFALHLAEVERKHGRRLTDERFRTKAMPSWGSCCYTHIFENGQQKLERGFQDVYYRAFLNGETYRESCYECRYAHAYRNEDLTIGDYWGAERFHPEITDASHPSIALAHTAKGNGMLLRLPDSMLLLPSRLKWAREDNHQLTHPIERPAIRKSIYHKVLDKGYRRWMRDDHRTFAYWRLWVRKHLPYSMRTYAKSALHRLRGDQ